MAKNKPIIISINENALFDDFDWLTKIKKPEIHFMHTACQYPAPFPYFYRLSNFKRYYPNTKWGYSDHTIGINNCLRAVKNYGVCIIEKHFKIEEDCVDSSHSINVGGLGDMINDIRRFEKDKKRGSGQEGKINFSQGES